MHIPPPPRRPVPPPRSRPPPQPLPARPLHSCSVQETERLQQVLKHPLYRQDPIQAISNHLNSTLAAAAAAAPPPLAQRQANAGDKKPKKPKQQQPGGSGQAGPKR